MDIQFAYNIERLLYYICNENSDVLADIMNRVDNLPRPGEMTNAPTGFQLDKLIIIRIKEIFDCISISDADTVAAIQHVYNNHNHIICPHSAVGISACLQKFSLKYFNQGPIICVLTAHPAKFSLTIENALGFSPPKPSVLTELEGKPPRYIVLEKRDDNWRAHWMMRLKEEILIRMK
jgi:threonine synthase